MSLSVIVLTYNGYDLLPDCLKSIGEIGDERIVVDNGSHAQWWIQEIAQAHRFEVRRIEENVGNIGGINKCFEFASNDTVLFVSDDVRFLRGKPNIKKLSHPIAQIMPIVRNPDLTLQTTGLSWIWPGYGVSKLMPWPSIIPSICFLMQKCIWKGIGKFDENLISSHEDVDMGLRLLDANFLNKVQKSWEVIHLANSTLSKTLTNHSKRFHESRRMVIKKHYSGIDRAMRLAAESLIYSATSSMQALNEIASKALKVVASRGGV